MKGEGACQQTREEENIPTRNSWLISRCLFVVYPSIHAHTHTLFASLYLCVCLSSSLSLSLSLSLSVSLLSHLPPWATSFSNQQRNWQGLIPSWGERLGSVASAPTLRTHTHTHTHTCTNTPQRFGYLVLLPVIWSRVLGFC